MTSPNDAKTAATAAVDDLARVRRAARTGLPGWSSAERMKRWFSPEGVDVPEAEIDFRPGGAFVICMRMPDGTEHWSPRRFGEIVAPEKLSFDCEVSTGGKRALLRPHAGAVRRRRRGRADDGRAELRDLRRRVPLRGRRLGRGLAHDARQAGARGRARVSAAAVRGAFSLERDVQGDAGAGLQGVRRQERQEPLVRRRRRATTMVERRWTCGRAGASWRSAAGRAA